MPAQRQHRLMRLALVIVPLLVLLPFSTACVCPPLPYRQIYRKAALLVKAEVLNMVELKPPRTYYPFEFRFKLKIIKVFKGCPPPADVFYAKSFPSGVICSVFLKKGSVHRLSLGPLQTDAKFPKKFYRFENCYEAKEWKRTTIKERRFLWAESRKKSNRCRKTS